ncbi:uncharacterized protein LOC123301443 [Chrysoperla carnea]|uniref:uncharacterized protein LOC123301443 n=1 Tax=Chrysoperla carnea TaxID=189513 RepID=UPI001D07374F|nr:uncharacterized protein LOC123301443 [Chrysoperla carnea]
MNYIIALLCVCGAVVISGFSINDQEIRLRYLLASGFGGIVPSLDPLHIDSFNLNNTLTNGSHLIAHNAKVSGLTTFDRININELYDNGSFVFQIHVPSIKFEMVVETNDVQVDSPSSGHKSDKFSATFNNINITVTGILEILDHSVSHISVDVQFSQNVTNVEIKDSNADNINLRLITVFGDAIHHYQKEICRFLCDYNKKLVEHEP